MQPQYNTCGVATQHPFDNAHQHKRLRLVRFTESVAKISPPSENSESFPQTYFADILRKLTIFRFGLAERKRTTNPRQQAELDRFLSSVKDDIQEMISALPHSSSLSLYTTYTPKRRVQMTVRFGVYGAVALLIERSDSGLRIAYDMRGINLDFCAIKGTRQAIESIVLESIAAIKAGRIGVTRERVLNGSPELQKRQLALLNDGGAA
jgi:hypothetical protein